MRLKVEYIDIDAIKTYENNTKLHPAEQVNQIKESIKEFGMNDPIAIHGEVIIEGHGRYIACKELGMKKVPVIRLDDLTDEQRKVYAIVHNKLTMNSGFDVDVLNDELQSITDINMQKYGFVIEEENIDLSDFYEPVENYRTIVCKCCKKPFRINKDTLEVIE